MPRSRKRSPPKPIEPTNWEHYQLWQEVHEAILALPNYFATSTTIEGMLASDIFTLNAALGATIEDQVVSTLNNMRLLWDPDRRYQAYSFTRQAQTFPDVLLRRKTDGRDILLGIELKGWYLLAKEGMPNFRFLVNRNACNLGDLLVTIPWVLSNVLSGSPVVFPPFIVSARYAAEKRNYYWQYERTTDLDTGIVEAENVTPYPTKSARIADRAVADSGSNFGRLARYGMMDDYIEETMRTRIRGVSAQDWLTFFRRHARESDEQ